MIPLTRTIDVLLKAIAVTFLLVVVAFLFGILTRYQKNVRKWMRQEEATKGKQFNPNWQMGRLDVPIIALGIVMVIVTVVAYHLPDQQFRDVTRVGGGTILVSSVAGGLFFLKVSYLRIYSLLEIGFALTLSARTMWNLGDEIDPMEALGIMTAAYLVIRGLDNFKKDLDARRSHAGIAEDSSAQVQPTG